VASASGGSINEGGTDVGHWPISKTTIGKKGTEEKVGVQNLTSKRGGDKPELTCKVEGRKWASGKRRRRW